MAAAAFLCRENAEVVYPQILYLFLSLMALNLAASLTLKYFPQRTGLSAVFILSNCAAITGILNCSGGAQSNLWVLYLLPIYTACLLINGRDAALITTGAISFNGAFVWLQSPQFGAIEAFELAVKTGLFIFCAAVTWGMVSRQRARAAELNTERQRLERLSAALAADRERLEHAEGLDESSLLVAGLAHDLKNSFTAIAGFAKLMEDEDSLADLKAETRCIAKAVRAAEEHLAAFIRTGADRTPDLVPDDINEIIRSAAPVFEGLLRPAGLRLQLRLQEPLPRIDASRGHLQRLFVNLVSNAAHAMKPGGTLTITTGKGGLTAVKISVEDDGPGLPEAALKNMFKPYATTRKAQGGTGLGLYNCAEIARQHNGRLHAENRLEGGARFELFLPGCPAAVAA
jgi:signal transduction histidine kinase